MNSITKIILTTMLLSVSVLADPASNLLDRNPFQPFDGQLTSTRGPSALQLTGIYNMDEKTGPLFCILDARSNMAQWVGPNESKGALSVLAHDLRQKVVTVSFNGESQTLYLKNRDTTPLPLDTARMGSSVGSSNPYSNPFSSPGANPGYQPSFSSDFSSGDNANMSTEEVRRAFLRRMAEQAQRNQ